MANILLLTPSGDNDVGLSTLDANWTELSGNTTTLIVRNGTLRPAAEGVTKYMYSGVAPTADYKGKITFVHKSSSSYGFSIVLRSDATAQNHYYGSFQGGVFRMGKRVSGTNAFLDGGAIAYAPSVDEVVEFEFEVSGTALTMRRNGTVIATATDSSHSAAGRIQLHAAAVSVGAVTDTKGQLLTEYRVDTLDEDDETAPTLTGPVDSATGHTTGASGVTTDEGNGTLYLAVTTSATPPSVAQIQLGHDHLDATAAFATSVAVSSSGVKSVNSSGLTPETAYWSHFQHKDAAGNDSAVVTVGTGFTTDAAPAPEAVAFDSENPIPNFTPTVGVPFSLDVSARFTGDATPFSYEVQAGTLPDGLSLADGVISGTPTTAEAQTGIVIRATDADLETADSNSFSITVSAPSAGGGTLIVNLIGF